MTLHLSPVKREENTFTKVCNKACRKWQQLLYARWAGNQAKPAMSTNPVKISLSKKRRIISNDIGLNNRTGNLNRIVWWTELLLYIFFQYLVDLVPKKASGLLADQGSYKQKWATYIASGHFSRFLSLSLTPSDRYGQSSIVENDLKQTT